MKNDYNTSMYLHNYLINLINWFINDKCTK